jgi:hypothetical protein
MRTPVALPEHDAALNILGNPRPCLGLRVNFTACYIRPPEEGMPMGIIWRSLMLIATASLCLPIPAFAQIGNRLRQPPAPRPSDAAGTQYAFYEGDLRFERGRRCCSGQFACTVRASILLGAFHSDGELVVDESDDSKWGAEFKNIAIGN